jgi:23S rRNA pseudouridine2605 synthase
MELKEGRKRQIRRMLALFGLEVTRLRRVRLGPLRLGELPPGKWRALDADEVRALRRAVALEDLQP